MALFYLVIVVFVSFLFCSAFHEASLILNASFGGGFSDTLCPALLVVLFWLAFLGVSLFFGGSPHVTAGGKVSSHTIVNRW